MRTTRGLVTGGMGGLGEAICIKLAEPGTPWWRPTRPATPSSEWLADMKGRGYASMPMPAT